MNKDKFFKIAQEMLYRTPVIIWGSGASVPLGLPTMSDLNQALGDKIQGFDRDNNNLEDELSKSKYSDNLDEIRNIIWEKINEKDLQVKNEIIKDNNKYIISIKNIIEYFKNSKPELVNIITTNYDRVLENILSYYNIPFSDGFIGRELSRFNEELFGNKNIVNILKVHGSLNWFGEEDNYFFLNNIIDSSKPKIIIPGKNKFFEGYFSPYRELIQRADSVIREASAFFIIGFGFNDQHLTPKVISKIRSGIPIVIITKIITDSCKKTLSEAKRYLCIEENQEKTKITYKEKGQEVTCDIEGSYWKLDEFLRVLDE